MLFVLGSERDSRLGAAADELKLQIASLQKQLDELDMYKQLLSAKLAASSTVLVAEYHSV